METASCDCGRRLMSSDQIAAKVLGLYREVFADIPDYSPACIDDRAGWLKILTERIAGELGGICSDCVRHQQDWARDRQRAAVGR